MVRAEVNRGEVRPLEPLPVDWQEGQELCIDKMDDAELTLEEIDRHYANLADLCSTSDPEDEERLELALATAKREAKEQVRRQMGLS